MEQMSSFFMFFAEEVGWHTTFTACCRAGFCDPSDQPQKLVNKLNLNITKYRFKNGRPMTTADNDLLMIATTSSQHSSKQLCKSDNLSCLIFAVVQ
jgi:hypothetical protein